MTFPRAARFFPCATTKHKQVRLTHNCGEKFSSWVSTSHPDKTSGCVLGWRLLVGLQGYQKTHFYLFVFIPGICIKLCFTRRFYCYRVFANSSSLQKKSSSFNNGTHNKSSLQSLRISNVTKEWSTKINFRLWLDIQTDKAHPAGMSPEGDPPVPPAPATPRQEQIKETNSSHMAWNFNGSSPKPDRVPILQLMLFISSRPRRETI